MKINTHERYGSGPRLCTRENKFAKVAIAIMLASAAGMFIVSLCLYFK